MIPYTSGNIKDFTINQYNDYFILSWSKYYKHFYLCKFKHLIRDGRRGVANALPEKIFLII